VTIPPPHARGRTPDRRVDRRCGIVNTFHGDGFMAVFGAPCGDEGAARGSVRAAIEIINHVDVLNASAEIRETSAGIGLHRGEVETAAVYDQIKEQIAAEPLPPATVKGRSAAVRLYKVGGARGRSA